MVLFYTVDNLIEHVKLIRANWLRGSISYYAAIMYLKEEDIKVYKFSDVSIHGEYYGYNFIC